MFLVLGGLLASAESVSGQGILSVMPAGGFHSEALPGQPFNPPGKGYSVQNTGASPIDYTVAMASGQNAFVLSKTSGTLLPGQVDAVIVTVNTGYPFTPGIDYSDTVQFNNVTNTQGNTSRAVDAIVIDTNQGILSVMPAGGFHSEGLPGQPFNPPGKGYSVQNTGASPIDYTVAMASGQNAFVLSKTSGTLLPGQVDAVIVTVNTGYPFTPGIDYSDTVQFNNVTNTQGNTSRAVDAIVIDGWDSISPPSITSDWEVVRVHFTSATEGWAAGFDEMNFRGVLLHYSGGTWTSLTPPSVSPYWELLGLHFTSSKDGWAVGQDYTNARGVLLHYSKSTWTSMTPPSVSSNWNLWGVHFTSSKEGWAVGYDFTNHRGVLLHCSKKTWASVTPPYVSSTWSLNAVHFTSATEGWAVGYDTDNQRGVLLHYSGGTWTSVTPPSVSSYWGLSGVYFISTTEGWAVGWSYDGANYTGVLLHYSGGTWTSVTPPSVSSNWYLKGVHFTSPTEGWAVGQDFLNRAGALLQYSGGKWTSVTPPSVSSIWELWGVHFTSATEGWAVGIDRENSRGVLLHYSIWPMSFSSKLNIKGFAHDSNVTEGWCRIYPDGTFILHDQVINRSYTGTYSIVPGGKSILFTLDANGLSEMQAMLTDWVTEMGANAGITIQNISFVFNPVSSFKGSIQKKTNAPSKLAIKISGTVTGLFGGVSKTMSFTYQNTIKYYSP